MCCYDSGISGSGSGSNSCSNSNGDCSNVDMVIVKGSKKSWI